MYRVIGGSFMKRMKQELLIFELHPPFGCYAEPEGDDMLVWKGFVLGPDDTPYAGG